MSKVVVRWLESRLMVGTDSNGNSIVIGKLKDDKVSASGMKPSDLLLLAAASCSSYDIVEILTKQREPLKDLQVICEGIQLDKPPYNFTKIHLHYIVTGDVEAKKLETAIQLSEDKYCSVINTLRPGVSITNDYEIISELH